jgi:hypothetical protein
VGLPACRRQVGLLERRSVDVDQAVADIDLIAADADDALDERRLILLVQPRAG